MYWIILIVFLGLGWLVSSTLKRRFREYAEVPTSSGLSGAEIAAKMLRDNGIHDVEIEMSEGSLTDHYDPSKKTIRLSENVFHGRHVAAAAVAAHETGHAVQHAESYGFLQMRSAMVPMMNFSSRLLNFAMIGGLIGVMLFSLNYYYVILAYMIGYAGFTLFSLVTLPVEFDASNRALLWLEQSRVTQGEEHVKAKNALRWAASTYVVSALGAITYLLYFASLLAGRD